MPKQSKKQIELEPVEQEKGSEGWQAFLEAQQRGIQRGALKRAVLGEPTEATQRQRLREGERPLQIALEPPVGVEPWTLDEETDA